MSVTLGLFSKEDSQGVLSMSHYLIASSRDCYIAGTNANDWLRTVLLQAQQVNSGIAGTPELQDVMVSLLRSLRVNLGDCEI